MGKILIPLLLVPFFAGWLHAQDIFETRLRTFELGEITITGLKDSSVSAGISIEQIGNKSLADVSRITELLPGINRANVGDRNEAVIYIRGFDLRQVPFFIDGIPVYVPFDGYVDLGRFMVSDISQVQVEKGFASIIYGPNTYGGAINAVSGKPAGPLDISGRAGIYSGNGKMFSLNAGTASSRFYGLANFSFFTRDFYPLSRKFEVSNTENGGERENSYNTDLKWNLKAGFTPNSTDEYAIGYINQQGEKGNPVYTGEDPAIRPRYWRWPVWDKESLYLISKKQLGEKSLLKVRAYYDTFVNTVSSYDDSTYTTQNRPSSFNSHYNDYNLGGNLEYRQTLSAHHHLITSVHIKNEVHREKNDGEPERKMSDLTYSIGVEDRMDWERFTLIPGIMYSIRDSRSADNYNSQTGEITSFPENDSDDINLQVSGITYPGSLTRLEFSIARKTRFATLKDRYSYRLGRSLPNPFLKTEKVYHLNGNLNQRLHKFLNLEAGVYYSLLKDVIQRVDNPADNTFQLQNTGTANFFGADLYLNYKYFSFLNSTIQYSFIQRTNLSDPDIQFTNVPDHKVNLDVKITPFKNLVLGGNGLYNSKRYSTSYGTSADPFTVLDIYAVIKLLHFMDIETGVNNLLDADYALMEGYPEPGRNFYLHLAFRFIKTK